MTTEQLVRLAEIYGQHRSLTLKTVSTYAMGGGRYFDALKKGANITIRVADRLSIWFSDHWPSDLEWPTDIPRPEPKKEVA
jgi:hypothetical protein